MRRDGLFDPWPTFGRFRVLPMALSLTTADLTRLETASRSLLSPLAAPSADAWRLESMAAVRDLLGARGATFGLPGAGSYFLGDEVDEAIVVGVDTFLGPAWRGTGPSPSPLVDLFHGAVVSMGLSAWDFPLIDDVMGGAATNFDYYHEVMVPGRITDTHTLFVPTAAGSVMLEVHDLRRPYGGGETLPLLQALVPSLRAGAAALFGLAERRAALAATLDALDRPLAAFDDDGRELHRNAALARLVAAEPHAWDLEAALGRTARALRRLAFPRAGEGPAPLGAAVASEVTTARGRYVFTPTVLPEGLLGAGGAFLVAVRADVGPAFPTSDTIRERLGLSAREAEVALLLAEGLTNAQIADRLFIASATARRHTENVLGKLGIGTRAAVASALLAVA